MSLISFAIVLGVGFWKHGLHFFSLFVPHGTPLVVKFAHRSRSSSISFLVRPFSLGLRPFIAMFAGHILIDVFGNFVVQGFKRRRRRIRRRSCRWLPVRGLRQRAGAAGRGDPGLRLRPPDRALHQRRGQSSLTFSLSKEFNNGSRFCKVIGAGLAAIGVGAAAVGVGYVFGSFLQSALRNPAAADSQQGRLFIGFAAAELLGLMAFAVAMIILYAI